MTSKSLERKTFNHYKKSLVRELGSKATEGEDLNRVAHRELGPAFAGVFPSDRVKLKPNKYYIINTDPHDKPGEHWIGMATTKKRAYIWDSYGRDIGTLVPGLIKKINKSGMQIGGTNTIPHGEQIGYSSEICGPYSLAFLLTVRDLGISRAKGI